MKPCTYIISWPNGKRTTVHVQRRADDTVSATVTGPPHPNLEALRRIPSFTTLSAIDNEIWRVATQNRATVEVRG